MRYSIEPRERRYIQRFGFYPLLWFLSFGNKYGKKN